MEKVNDWDINTSDARTANKLTTFLIFCEDEVSEPIYFRSFQNEYLKVNAIENQKKGKLNLSLTLQNCIKDGLMVFQDGYQLAPGTTENIWCVYDRDFENADIQKVRPEDNVSWDAAIQTAEAAGLKVSWSNDAFELWILLHFQDVTPAIAQHRDQVYQLLTEVFKTIQPRTPELEQVTAHPHFYYKYAFKKPDSFIQHVLPFLKDRRAAAIARAEDLWAAYQGNIPYHMRNPCTKVHQLVCELLLASQPV